VVAAGAALVICVPALHQWQVDQPAADQSTATLLAHAQAPFGDDRPADAILRRIAAGDHTATPAQVQAALELTATESKIDSGLAALRRTVAARYGLPAR